MPLLTNLHRWLLQGRRSLGMLLIPPRCVCCGLIQNRPLNTGLCERCFELIVFNDSCEKCDFPLASHRPRGGCRERPGSVDAIRAPHLYGGPMAELIKAIKFDQRTDLAGPLARLLAEDPRAADLAAQSDCIIPVPLGRKRLRQRGHNQAALLARGLAHTWDLPIIYTLQRRRETRSQSLLPKHERAHNLQDAFETRRPLVGRSVLLVDDVVTTGQTVAKAAEALRAGGAGSVHVVAAARTLSPLPCALEG